MRLCVTTIAATKPVVALETKMGIIVELHADKAPIITPDQTLRHLEVMMSD